MNNMNAIDYIYTCNECDEEWMDSNEEFTDGGSVCPFCGSGDVEVNNE